MDQSDLNALPPRCSYAFTSPVQIFKTIFTVTNYEEYLAVFNFWILLLIIFLYNVFECVVIFIKYQVPETDSQRAGGQQK